MIDDDIVELAEMQHGLVATRQIRALGGDDQLVRRRVRSGRWERPATRVVRIAGAPRTPEQRLMCAVLQAGEGALASHRSAAWLWRLPGYAPGTEILRPRSHGERAAHGHRPLVVLPDHLAEVRGIPVTSLPRTLFDLAGVESPARMTRLVDTVVGRSPAMLPALHRTLEELACRGRTGTTTMRLVLRERPIGSVTPPTGLERRFEELCRRAGIVGLERQVDIGGQSWLGRADYVIRSVRLPIEVDSELHHTTVSDRRRDAARDAAMRAAGWADVLRITEEDVWYRPWSVPEQVRAAIQALDRVAA